MIWHGFIVSKLVFLLFSVMFIDQYMEWILVVYGVLIQKTRKISFEKKIDGVSVEKLVDFLFQYNGLPTNEFLDRFHVSKDVLKKLWDNLEKLGILTRGNKNARIISSLFDSEEVFQILEKYPDSSALSAPLLQTSENSYSFVSHRLLPTEN